MTERASRQLAVAGAIWTVGILLSRLIGLVRERVIGATLGATGTADAYAAAFRIPDLAVYLLASGALSITLLPLLSAHQERGDGERASRTFSVVANFLLLLAVCVLGAAWLLAPTLAPLLSPGFDDERLALLVRLSRIVLPAQLFFVASPLLQAALLARDRHAPAALAPLVYNGCIVAGGLLRGDAEGFAWGVLVGAALGPFGLQLWGARAAGLRWSLAWDTGDADFRTFILRALPIMLGQSVVVWDDTLLTRFGSRLHEGQVAVLNYAKTLMRVPMGVFGQAMGYAAFPVLARMCLNGRQGEAYRTIVATTRHVLLLAVGSQVVLTVAGTDIATLIYTTRRMSPAQLTELGHCAGVFSLALAAWSAQPLFSRGFYARGRTWVPTAAGMVVLVASVPLYAFAAQFGAGKLAYASSAAIVVYTLVLEALLRREIGEGPGYLPALWRLALAGALAISLGFGVERLLPERAWTSLDAAWRLALTGGLSGGAYLAVAALVGLPEARALLKRFRVR
jgi:putative peptidoglycan lipid II flippase